MAAGNLISLTEKVSGTVRVISEDAILSMLPADGVSDSRIKYLNQNNRVVDTVFEDTIAAVVILAPKLLPFTLQSDGSTIYINGERIKTSDVDPGGSVTKYDTETSAWESVKLTESPATVLTDVNA